MKLGKFTVYAAAVLASLFWGYSFVWFKQANQFYDPLTIVILRLIISSIVIAVILKVSKHEEKIAKEDWKHLLLLAFFEPFLYFLGESFGLTMVSATTGAIIITTIPLFTPIFTHFLAREQISVMGVAGLLLSFVGVIMVVTGDKQGENSILGIALMFLAVFAAILYGISLKKLAHSYSGFTIVKYQNLFGIVYFLPLFLMIEAKGFFTSPQNLHGLYTIGLLAVFPSTLSFAFIAYVVKKIGLINANLFANLIPVFTAVIAYFVLQEALHMQKIMGIFIVTTGLFISQIPQFKKLRK
jgi:drug/metabolite transporter (DMT)-like permease